MVNAPLKVLTLSLPFLVFLHSVSLFSGKIEESRKEEIPVLKCPKGGPDPLVLPFSFRCGYVGFLGYEVGADTSPAHTRAANDGPPSERQVPDAFFFLADRVLAFDHIDKSVYLLALEDDDGNGTSEETVKWLDEVEGVIDKVSQSPRPWPAASSSAPQSPVVGTPSMSEEAYRDAISQCFESITEGETYEVCLTNQFVFPPLAKSPFDLYTRLRSMNPAPFSAFFRVDPNGLLVGTKASSVPLPPSPSSFAICSASPERLIRLDKDGWMESKPIKGTSRRGGNAIEDTQLKTSLMTSTKTIAENLMIVDLVRNDLSRVAKVGSVSVPNLMDVESFSTVHQLVSTIRGQLQEDKNSVDAIAAVFPGGSMTGKASSLHLTPLCFSFLVNFPAFFLEDYCFGMIPYGGFFMIAKRYNNKNNQVLKNNLVTLCHVRSCVQVPQKCVPWRSSTGWRAARGVCTQAASAISRWMVRQTSPSSSAQQSSHHSKYG